MSRGFRAVSSRREGKVHQTRFTEPHGIKGLDGLVGIAADLASTLELTQRHEVSREAAARRYIPRIGDPAAVVFSKAGVVRYARCNEFFPGSWPTGPTT